MIYKRYFIFVLALAVTGYAFFLFINIYQIPNLLPFNINELPAGDESTLIDLKNFNFILNHDTCSRTQPYLLVMVHSAPQNLKRRNTIRETWGQVSSSVITVFLVGWSEKYQTELVNENFKFGDLIQGNFLDTYRNLTYKHIMALKWAIYYCSYAKYILKLDDDVYVHITAVLDYLKHKLPPRRSKHLILCNPLTKAPVIRSNSSKWGVSLKEYTGSYYPKYCLGPYIFYSPYTAFSLYRQAQKEPFFWIDDVHVTGTIASKVNVTRNSLNSLALSLKEQDYILLNSNCSKNFLFGSLNLGLNEIRALHNIVSHC
ncbi:lactosylceramide 1,3-N-acetyl-beta-D-glucosaminyltransferase-like [Leptopilina boulardi]|uniref:lactosylceramide 1,3-N-acetyl-beta-D-glucosaminyltransferase-like n=1 Tax=Leptopilina boulardi TaxID=63433 RepID=UPI0021F5E345|nr:lactosylceramide 1,3-N-acetyl-beta-D-glucosaminyltransferase-like [Leptopilina boulardi]XP_051176633.1 lactosylceramide 1,3-N-acetyl-beta-D-glucosaminyltransferase-like [Leptopilina boulardi]XP_051176634.1 lactosylceramide 1,3-N-acetyl-beta-D-glucosaminyltransferase-like [Leptopilina boulardi]XP_051176635.1 lactosylceramide 1,3-N-acetyl-beta-D-glucosaminyltransferase-like [Leptopilina boulardi]